MKKEKKKLYGENYIYLSYIHMELPAVKEKNSDFRVLDTEEQWCQNTVTNEKFFATNEKF